MDVIKVVLILRSRLLTICCGTTQPVGGRKVLVMEGREEGWLSSVLGDHLRKHLPGVFLGNVDFVDKIYGGNVGEYLTNSLLTLSPLLLSI